MQIEKEVRARRGSHILIAALCVLVVATTAMAWEQLEQIPTTTGAGTRITGGWAVNAPYHYYTWGIFPNGSYTRFGYSRVDTQDPSWTLDAGNVVLNLVHTSATHQWQGDGMFFFSGHAYNSNRLYLCDWSLIPTSVDLPVAPGAGSCITYVPNGNYPGWVYYLSQSNGGQFWRYSLAAADNVVVDGICPGEGAITGNSAPLFQ